MELSVIIPIYNVRNTLRRCLQSILCQQMSGMEVLLIDDGSTDGSGSLADDMAVGCPVLTVLHKANGGPSDARNAGLRLAQGRYVTFVDADDEVAPGTFAALMSLLHRNEDTDILEYSVRVHAGHSSEHELVLPDKRWPSARAYWEESEAWEHAYPWNKVYRSTLFARVQFPVGRVFEDLWAISQLLSQDVRVQTTSLGLYIYHWNKGGITVNADGMDTTQLLEAQMRAARLMHTSMLSRRGWKLYRSMLYRQLDVYRLTGRILLRWPFVKLICRLHKSCR